MHQTGKGYRQDGHRGGMGVGYVVLCIVAMLMPSLAWPQGQAEEGQPLYTRYCARCHGADGRGGPMVTMLPVRPRNLADQTYMQTRTEEQLFEVIKHGGGSQGLSPTMPGFSQQLSDSQVWDTVAYIRTFAGAPRTAGSQSASSVPLAKDIRIQRLSVSIWPEYDDPRVLVILRGELAPESPVPTRIQLPIPKGAELLGAGMISSQNKLLNHPHQLLDGDTSDTLELTLPVHRFFAEWYYDPFGEREPARQFTYPLTFSYAVGQLNVDILQPDAATEFRVTPAPMREDTDTRGGKHHLFSYPDLEPKATQTFEVAYVKATDAPSITKSPARSENAQAGLSRSTKTWVTFAMLAGFTIIFAGSVLIFRNKQPTASSVAPVVPAIPSSAAIVTDAETASPSETAKVDERAVNSQEPATPNYCSDCGRQLLATFAFCPGCGRSLQTS